VAKLELGLPDGIDLAQFVSAQAHDLRSPFNHIVGFAKLVLNGQDGPLTDLQREDLATVYQSGLRALALMNNLIDMARLSRREKTVSPARVDPALILEQAIAQWKKFNPARKVQVETDFQTAASLLADEALLKQAVVGFLALAAAYTEDPAKLVVRTEVEPGWQTVTISSQGTRPPVPSALDLAMCGCIGRGMVELNGGCIRSAEESAEGAVICFALPL